LWWWRPTLHFEPDGLIIKRRWGKPKMLPWDEGSREWSVTGVPRTLRRPGIFVRAYHASRDTHERHDRLDLIEVWLPSTWSAAPIEELPALTEYLKATPQARSSLAMPQRLELLVTEFATRAWRQPRPPNEPLLGDRLDIFVAVGRALDFAQWRRFGGRPVRHEPAPSPDYIAQRARALLAKGVSARVSDDKLEDEVERHLTTAAWPFDVLVQ
jgi:hypothetical protein